MADTTLKLDLRPSSLERKTLALFTQLDSKREALSKLRPLSAEQAEDLKRLYDVDLTYNSNAIEGSTLSYAETRVILEKGITVSGKPLREHLEVINHKEAIDFIEELANQSAGPVGESDLLAIHNLILRGIDSKNAGRYRTVPVGVRQSDGQGGTRLAHFCDPLQVPDQMQAFMGWIGEEDTHPVQKASEAHLHLVSIHPFIDGNGRTAGLLMNLMLIQKGFPPAIVPVARRAEYIQALETAQVSDNRNPFLQLIGDALAASLDLYLDTLRNGTRYV